MGMPFSSKSAMSTTSGGSRWTTNPRHLPVIVQASGGLVVKTAAGTVVNTSAAGSFTAIAQRGAQTSISGAGVFTTIVNISGSGVFVSAFSPTHTASHTPTIRITVDGVAYTFSPSAALTATHRIVVGFYTSGYAASAVDGYVVGTNSYNDTGFAGPLVGGYPVVVGATTALITPEAALTEGLPLLRFEKSLKVEAKCDFLSATPEHKQCAAIYRVDP